MVQEIEGVSGKFIPVYWNVVFASKKRENWWDFFIPHWCRHVLCYAYSMENDYWIVINPGLKSTLVSVVPVNDIDEYIYDVVGIDPTIIQVMGHEAGAYSNRYIQSCATIVARIVGIKRLVLTPKGLFNSLCAIEHTLKEDPHNVYKGQNT